MSSCDNKKVIDTNMLSKFVFWIVFTGIGGYNYYSDIVDPESTLIVKLFHINLPGVCMMIDMILLFYFGMNAWRNSYFITTEKEQGDRIMETIGF